MGASARLIETILQLQNQMAAVKTAAPSILQLKNSIQNVPFGLLIPGMSQVMSSGNILSGLLAMAQQLGGLGSIPGLQSILGQINQANISQFQTALGTGAFPAAMMAYAGGTPASANTTPTANTTPPPSTSGYFVELTITVGSGLGVKFGASLPSGGVQRTFLLYVPANYNSNVVNPLVLVFHGGGGSGKTMAKTTNFSDVADGNGFLLVFPDGLDKQWNDGDGKTNLNVDDISFVRDLITYMETNYSVNTNKIYACGHSEGAHFCCYLALELPGVLAGIAPVAGPIFANIANSWPLSTPIAVCGIQGTVDTHDPYLGGTGSSSVTGVVVESTANCMLLWQETNHCNATPMILNPIPQYNDGTSVEIHSYTGGSQPVTYYIVDGMGHQWPPNFNPASGDPSSNNINASQTIWEFFSQQTL